MNFEGKTYLVTGGSSGIGLAVCERLARGKARLILVSDNLEKLEKTVDCLAGRGHLIFPCDLAYPENIGGVFDFLQKKDLRLDGMVHSAGIAPLCMIRDNTVELMERVFRINFFSFVELVKYFQMEQFSTDGSRIVAVASITAHGAGYRQTLYGASKAALISSVKLMAKELLNRNIRINCISPGVADTPMLEGLREKSTGFDEKLKANQPLGAVTPDNIAEAAVYLLSSGSDFLTGTDWMLDGGAMLK